MPHAAVAEQPETQVAEAEQGCPVVMYEGQRCDRPIYAAPEGIDWQPVCLMHSRDPNKDDAAFQAEFERILRDARDGVADFTEFVFPSANYYGRELKPRCVFRGATFAREAHFNSAKFAQEARFNGVKFLQRADFSGAKFAQAAHFHGAKFTQDARFSVAAFTEAAIFVGARFTQSARFRRARFTREADFSQAAFAQDADFSWAGFDELADFSRAIFKERAEFRETIFRENARADHGPVLVSARFEKPELANFYKTHLGRALFHNCDVSRFVFSAVRWRQRPNGKRMVLEEAQNLDPSQEFASALRTEAGDPDERSYGLIAELYQQLKKNYDDRKDYWTAGDFHYGEMEMKRLATPDPNCLSRWVAGKVSKWLAKENPGFPARWAKNKGYSERSFHILRREWHRHLGLAAWYKYASEYGESYGRPLLWLAGILILFTFLYPWPGLRPSAKSSSPELAASESRMAAKAHAPELSYSNFIRYGSVEPESGTVSYWSLPGHSLMSTIGIAAFQRDLAYEPTYPWGRLLAIVEILLTSTLLALFLLAVRRQFRR